MNLMKKMKLFHTVLLAGILFPIMAQQQTPVVSEGRPIMVEEASPKAYAGMVEAINRTDVMPRVTGELRKVNCKEGDFVTEGMVMYELEDTTYEAAVKTAEAQLEQAKAQLVQAEAAVKQSGEGVRHTKREFERQKRLFANNATTEQSYDAAEHDHLLALAVQAVAEGQVAAAKAAIESANAAIIDAKNNLSYTKIKAAQSGVIGKDTYTRGNLVTPSAGKMNTIVQVAPIYVKFSISERVFRRDFGGDAGIKDRAVVRILLADGKASTETAKIVLVDNVVNSATNTVTLWAEFKNESRELKPGSYVTVLLSEKSQGKFVAVPPSVLVVQGDGYVVYVLDEKNMVSARPVRTGGVSNGFQIILSGLKGDERIVSEGMQKVRPGMAVTVAPSEK